MAKTFRTQGAGASQTLHEIEDEKIPVYDTMADAEADLANLAEEQIVATKDGGADEQTLIDYVDGRLETITTEIAMDTFKTGSKAQLNKSGNTVQFNYYASDYSTYNPIPVGVWTQIGTIPAELRPKQTIVLNCQGMEVQGESMGIMSLDTTGAIRFLREASSYNHDFSFQCSYNIDGTNSHGMTVNTLKDAKDYTDARAVRKFNYTMTGTDNVYNDIKALCNQLVGLGVNTYAGSFLRSARTYGYYSITVNGATNPVLLNGTVVVDNEQQGKTNSYTVTRVNDAWNIMPTMLNSNIHVTDCNPIVNPGIYIINNLTANTPYTGCYGILESKGFNPDIPSDGSQWIFQEVLDTSGRRFTRHCINPNTLAPISSQWTDWQEEDVLSHDLIVTGPSTAIAGYLSQIKYFLSNADWSKINNVAGFRREFVGSMELTGYWYGTYHLSNLGSNYKLINGAIYGEGQPVRFSGWYDPNYSGGWRVTLSYNYTYVDISGQQYIGNLNEQLCTALNLLAPQTWNVQHCECNIEVLGYFYAMCTFDMRGSYASVYGTILSANPNINGQAFTAEFETTRNYWVCRYTTKVFETAKTSVTTDSNGLVNLESALGIPTNAEIISVKAWNENAQGQPNADWMVIAQTNCWGTWYAHVASWGGPSVGTTTLFMQVKYRLLY